METLRIYEVTRDSLNIERIGLMVDESTIADKKNNAKSAHNFVIIMTQT